MKRITSISILTIYTPNLNVDQRRPTRTIVFVVMDNLDWPKERIRVKLTNGDVNENVYASIVCVCVLLLLWNHTYYVCIYARVEIAFISFFSIHYMFIQKIYYIPSIYICIDYI